MNILQRDEFGAKSAVELLKCGEICVLPTDTVYGFSAIVSENFDTAKKIRNLKGRSEEKPFIQLVSTPQFIVDKSLDEIPQKILHLLPGAITLIVRTKVGEIAYRCPNDRWLCSIIESCGNPIYSTSVNKSGESILSSVQKISLNFPTIPLIIDGGNLSDSLPSTIVKILPNKSFCVIRQGSVPIQNLV